MNRTCTYIIFINCLYKSTQKYWRNTVPFVLQEANAFERPVIERVKIVVSILERDEITKSSVEGLICRFAYVLRLTKLWPFAGLVTSHACFDHVDYPSTCPLIAAVVV